MMSSIHWPVSACCRRDVEQVIEVEGDADDDARRRRSASPLKTKNSVLAISLSARGSRCARYCATNLTRPLP